MVLRTNRENKEDEKMKYGWRTVGLLLLIFGLILGSQAFAAVPVCTMGYINGADVPGERGRTTGAVVGNRLYVFGGWAADMSTPTNTTFAYDPITDTWEAKADIPVVITNACAAALDGKIYLVGGTDGGTNYNSLYVYDPEADTWTTGANLPDTLWGVACAALNGKIYAAGGTGGAASNKLYEYDPAGDTWATLADLPGNVYGAGATTRGGKLYVVGGYSSTTNYEWTPGTPGTWATKAAIPHAARTPSIFTPIFDYSPWDQFVLMGEMNGGTDLVTRGYDVSGNNWFTTVLGSVPIIQAAAGASNFYDAMMIIAAGYDGGAYIKTTTIFKLCAPYVAYVDPAEVVNYDSAKAATIKGLDFDDAAGSGFWLESAKAEIALTVTVTDTETATTTLPADLEAGTYGVKVENGFTGLTDWNIRTIPDRLTVTAPTPEITSIDPDSAEYGTGELDVTIEGNHFFEPVTVKLSGPAKAEIACDSPDITDFTSIACTLDLSDAEAGTYDLVVTTDNGDGTLAGAFEVTAPPADDDTDDDTGDDDSGGGGGGGCGCGF